MILNRTQNAINNVVWGLATKVVVLIFPFLVRSVLIKTLGIDYLGLNGLFTSVLTILNITELGVGTAIVYSMYKPIAEDDTLKICALMNLYKKLYRIIGGIVLFLGLCLIPFLKLLINGTVPLDINLYIVYLIYLINSVVSYWLFAYKNCLLTAHQRLDTANKVQIFTSVIMYLAQIGLLLTTHNFYVFALCLPVLCITQNIITAYFATKMFPVYQSKGEIDKRELKEIKKCVAGLLMTKIAFISRGSIGNIVISAFLGLNILGIYNNYFYIITSVTSCLFVLTASVSAGLGNSIVLESKKKNEQQMRVFQFIFMLISFVCFSLLVNIFQLFVTLWLGEEFLLGELTMFCFAIYFLVEKTLSVIGQYYDAAGLWWRGRWKGFIETMINLLFVIIGCKYAGIVGTMIASSLTIILVGTPLTIYYIYRYYFYKSPLPFILITLGNLFIFILMGLIVYYICNMIPVPDNIILAILVKVVSSLSVSIILFLVVFYKTNIYKETKRWILYHKKTLNIM